MYFSRLAAGYVYLTGSTPVAGPPLNPPPGLKFQANGGARTCPALKIEPHLATLRLLHTWVTIGSATWNWAGPRLTAPHGLPG